MVKKILCIGEALIDLICTDKGVSLSKGQHFLKKPGGAPTNVAAAIAALGGSVELAAKVGADPFGKYLALGVTVTIVVQALLNMSVALDLTPTKGFGLPLISFGGSSLLSTMISLGMLLSVSEHEG